MGAFSVWHWLILLVVVLLVFGTSKLKNAGKDLGAAVKGFKDAVKEGEEESKSPANLENKSAEKDDSVVDEQENTRVK